MARWIDMENDYKTLDLKYMESVWWVCKQLFDKDLIVSRIFFLLILHHSLALKSMFANTELNLM